jgi:hypothetical protein
MCSIDAPRSLTTTYPRRHKSQRHSHSRRHSHKRLSNSNSSSNKSSLSAPEFVAQGLLAQPITPLPPPPLLALRFSVSPFLRFSALTLLSFANR